MTLNSTEKINFILGRRSVRVYATGDVGDAAVKQMLEAAMAAPSAMTKDPWRFVVVRDQNKLQQLAAALPGGKMLTSASLAIVVCGDLESAFEQNVGYMLQDCSAAIQNLLLAAHALGLGSCWVGIYPSDASVRQVKEVLKLPKPVLPIACIALGNPGEQLEARTRYCDAFVHREAW